MPEPTILERIAERSHLSPRAARHQLRAAAIPFGARMIMAVVTHLWPEMFRIDLDLVEHVGRARTLAEVQHQVEMFRYRSKGDGSWLRGRLGVRASGRRVLAFVETVF